MSVERPNCNRYNYYFNGKRKVQKESRGTWALGQTKKEEEESQEAQEKRKRDSGEEKV